MAMIKTMMYLVKATNVLCLLYINYNNNINNNNSNTCNDHHYHHPYRVCSSKNELRTNKCEESMKRAPTPKKTMEIWCNLTTMKMTAVGLSLLIITVKIVVYSQ